MKFIQATIIVDGIHYEIIGSTLKNEQLYLVGKSGADYTLIDPKLLDSLEVAPF